MNEVGCEWAREWLPDYVGEHLPGVDAERMVGHLEACEQCRAEADLIRLLLASRPPVPVGLAGRIDSSIRPRPGARHPAWGLAAAAVAVLALGIGVSSRSFDASLEVPAYVSEASAEGPLWLSDDGLIAGAPALDGLTEEALVMLLEEMTGGGAA